MKLLPFVRSAAANLPRAGKAHTAPLGFWSATALVIASMVGTGVFTASGFLLADLKTPVHVLWVWAGGGLLACLGALSYGALARRLPDSGGEYLFLSRTLHPAAGYIAGWISFLVGFSAPVAFGAYAFGEYSAVWWPSMPVKWTGTLLILVLSFIHASKVQPGAWVQNLAVLLKLGLLLWFCAAALRHLPGNAPALPVAGVPISIWAAALMWVSFAYSGWNAAVYLGAEVRAPEQNLPRAMLVGTLVVTVLYLLVNSVWLYSAPVEQLAGKPDIGRASAQALGGPAWSRAVTSLIALVLVSSVSSQIMAGPRVYAKMAADGYLPACLIQGQHPPRLAIALQALAAFTMLWTASFEWFLTYIGFTLGLSTAATVLGLIRLRLREGSSLKVIGWPWVQISFLAGIVLTTMLAILAKPEATGAGLGTILASWVAWRIHHRWKATRFWERGGLWVIIQSLLMLSVLVCAGSFRSGQWPRFCLWTGMVMISVGALFGISGVWVLKTNRTIFPKPREHSQLVQTGVYRLVRHPLYTSVMFISGGWALVWGSGVALAIALLMVPFFYAKARAEERWLRERFPHYREYEESVRRFLPWLF